MNPMTINPIANAYPVYENQASQPAVRQPQPQPASLPQDTVTLSSTGDIDHDGDSH